MALMLSQQEKQLLSPYISTLNQLEINEIGKILVVLDEIDTLENPVIEKWKNKIQNAVFNYNSEEYSETLALIE
ncbi:MAG: hypothetical protein EAZ85_10325 [Bacteroidetes bacterium]|nr:MAG: hypothetical protein EAZ85_10325 [Bacteroidota bacterium]